MASCVRRERAQAVSPEEAQVLGRGEACTGPPRSQPGACLSGSPLLSPNSGTPVSILMVPLLGLAPPLRPQRPSPLLHPIGAALPATLPKTEGSPQTPPPVFCRGQQSCSASRLP